MQRQNDAVFGIKAREERHANQRQRTRQRGQVRNGHVFAQTAHVAHVLIMVHGHDDRTRRQEQQGFEESVRKQMEQGHLIGRSPQPHHHIAQLRQGRISYHPFDVVLDQTHQTHEKRGGRPHGQNHVERHIAQFKQRRHA